VCGRYASSRQPEDLIEEFEIRTPRFAAPLEPDFNVAPTKEIYGVVARPPAEEDEPERQLRVLRWGLVPSWAKDASIGSRLINARMETVAEKPSFRKAFAKRRCLLPADGYFEWYPTERTGRGGKPVKQPFYITPRDGGILAMAGLYEIWRDPSRAEDDPDRFRWTATVITTTAEDSLGHLHDRMPLMVEPDRWQGWLDPRVSGPDLLDLLQPAAPGHLDAYPVATLVNNVKNNGPELIKPIPIEPDTAQPDTIQSDTEDALW
jgi:putative SOS response-associated peptidase YedK